MATQALEKSIGKRILRSCVIAGTSFAFCESRLSVNPEAALDKFHEGLQEWHSVLNHSSADGRTRATGFQEHHARLTFVESCRRRD